MSIFIKQDFNDPDKILYLCDYHPRRGGNNPNHDPNSERILQLKYGNDQAVRYFYEMLEPLLSEFFLITIVPSHKAGKFNPGLVKLVQKLVDCGSRTNAVGDLQRFITVPKAAYGGRRCIEQHLNSIRVTSIANISYMLLDDVTTTGNSLRACQKLLLDAGATYVKMVALAKTFRG